MDSNNYDKAFSIRKFSAHRTKIEKNKLALEKAHEIRKFEIDLYWKRTTYFWTIIAAIFAGYILLASKNSEKTIQNGDWYLILIAFAGFIFSYGWFLLNKGSKFWQENWEFHIDKLEDEITGPLYKTVLYKKPLTTKEKKWKNHLYDSGNFSVSKINQFIAFFTMVLWLILMAMPSSTMSEFISIILLILVITYIMCKHTRSEITAEPEIVKIKAASRKTEF
ncbi:RipA family octameric membrane protein [Vagococcus sp. WN89Y]|uniref:RipA family octameric membrane protein n=1 Tax=Vagococcus sp. WN89Y TaxID=3457258 RepID=UPI003FCE9842